MRSRGMNHFGLMTHDLDRTIEFYRDVLGFDPVAFYLRENPEANAHIRQAFFDLGNGQSLEFAQSHGMPGFGEDFDPGINEAMGTVLGFGVGAIHFAFDAASKEEVEDRKKALEANGVEVLGPIDLDWVYSIYFKDPNGVQLEFAYTVRFPPGDDYLEPVKTDTWQRLKAETAKNRG